MNRLAGVLKSITTLEGSPDYDARKHELSSLIQHLTGPEIRDLRAQLNSRIIPNDLCVRFPVEIVQEIAKYLDLEEVIRARHVSKSWLDVFGGYELSQKLLKWHFPRIWEREFKNIVWDKQASDGRSPQKKLLAQAEKSLRRKKGLYLSTATYRLPARVASLEYCNGTVAFVEVGCETLHVWNLRTNKQIIHKDTTRQKICNVRLTDSILVYENENGTVLKVKRLDLPNDVEPTKLRLPRRNCNYSAQNDQIGITLSKNYEIMIWRWGGPLREVNISGLTSVISPFDLEEDHFDIFFHPYDAEKIFIAAYKQSPDTEDSQIIISEGVLVESKWEWEVLYNEPYPPPDYVTVSHRWHRTTFMPTHGDDIGILKLSESDSAFEWWQKCNGGLSNGPPSDNMKLEYMTFNMLTREIERHIFQMPQWYENQFHQLEGVEDLMLFRADQVLLPVHEVNTTSDENASHTIVALNAARSSSIAKSIPSFDSESTQEYVQSWTGGTFIPDQKSFYRHEEAPDSRPAPTQIKGDDDFVIFLEKHQLTVWCFDDSVSLPQDPMAE